jgi:metallo-beta-lactamase family protein
MKIKFLGAAQTVTGSKTLIEYNGKRILIDCGLFQGMKALRLQNWDPFPIDIETIDEVILTHAHLDHVGHLPLLVKQGYQGNIHCTHPTYELAKIILLDSAKIQEEEAHNANKFQYSKHQPAEPLYNTYDARMAFSQMVTHSVHQWISLDQEISFRFHPNGHILGACWIELKINNKTLVFSGDIGRDKNYLLPPPTKPTYADILIMESTYGNRVSKSIDDAYAQFIEILALTMSKGGKLIIPSFTVERAQELMLMISTLTESKQIPHVPVYLDSPMAIDATQVMYDYPEWNLLDDSQIKSIHQWIQIVQDREQTMEIIEKKGSCILIAGSGMLTGGRVLDYIKYWGDDSNNTILLVGYQAEGTRGRKLLEGERSLKIHGQYIQINAEIKLLEGFSGHADQTELVNWLSDLSQAPELILLNHGEPLASEALKTKIESTFQYTTSIALIEKEYKFSDE